MSLTNLKLTNKQLKARLNVLEEESNAVTSTYNATKAEYHLNLNKLQTFNQQAKENNIKIKVLSMKNDRSVLEIRKYQKHMQETKDDSTVDNSISEMEAKTIKLQEKKAGIQIQMEETKKQIDFLTNNIKYAQDKLAELKKKCMEKNSQRNEYFAAVKDTLQQ